MGPNRKNKGNKLFKKSFCENGFKAFKAIPDAKPLSVTYKNMRAKYLFPRFLFPLDANRMHAFNNENKVAAKNMKGYKLIILETQRQNYIFTN